MSGIASDEQAEKLREGVLETLLPLGWTKHGGFADVRRIGYDATITLDDGTEYAIHVLPVGEAERLRGNDELLRKALTAVARQAALIDEIRTSAAAHRFVDTSGIGEASDTEAIRSALARYDETNGAKS